MTTHLQKYGIIYALFLLPGLSGLLFGYSISAATGALGPDDLSKGGHPQIAINFKFTTTLEQTFTSMSMVGALLGSIVVFNIGDKVGRKGALLISSFFYLAGSVIIASTPLPGKLAHFNSTVMLILGQLVYGIGVGFAMHSAPLYISETSPAEIRGFLVTMKEEMIVGGILVGYVIGFAFQNTNEGWRFMYFFPAAGAIIMFFGLLLAPESPRVLILQSFQKQGSVDFQAEEKATEALRILRPTSSNAEIREELNSIKSSLESSFSEATGGSQSVLDLFRGATLPALAIGLSLVFFQQATGQPSVLAYSSQIFRSAGYKDKALLASVAVGAVKFVATGLAVLTSDKFGRKPLLLIGTTGMMIALALLAVAFGVSPHDSKGVYTFSPAWSVVTLGSLMVYVSSYQVGYGPIVWLLQSEIFPLNARGRAQSIAVLVNFGMNSVVSLTFLTILNLLSPAGSFAIYGGLCIASNLVVLFFLPETKGKTLEEIQGVFSRFYKGVDSVRNDEAQPLIKKVSDSV